MITAPSVKVTGKARPHWHLAELPGCPYGTLVCAICPNDAPEHVVRALHPEECEYAERLGYAAEIATETIKKEPVPA